MRSRIDISPTHSRAISQEIGERLRAYLKDQPALSATLRRQIDRTSCRANRHRSFPTWSTRPRV